MHRHFTATAFVRDSQGRVLLLWHKRLGRWMPPGGHTDPDETPEETARRECREETGLDVKIVGDAQPDLFADAAHEGQMLKRPFAMLLENIPAYDKPVAGGGSVHEPAHQHMDFLYLATPLDESQALVIAEQEADHLRWFTTTEIQALGEEEIFTNVREYVRFMNKHF